MAARVRVGRRVARDRAVLLEHVDHTPVAEPRHRDARELLERPLVVECAVEHRAHLGDELRLLLGGLGATPGVPLLDEERRALALDLLAGGDVAHEPREERMVAARLDGGDRQLDRELASVGAARGQLEPLSQEPRLGALDDAPQRVSVGVAKSLGDDQRGHLLPQDVLAPVAEEALGGGVELHDVAVSVDRDDGVEGGLEDRGLDRLAFACGLLGLLELDVLAELAAEPAQELQRAPDAAFESRARRTRPPRRRGPRRALGMRARPTDRRRARPPRGCSSRHATRPRPRPARFCCHACPGSPSPGANVVRRLSPTKPAAFRPGSCQTSTTRRTPPDSSTAQSVPSCHPSVRPIASSALGVPSASEPRLDERHREGVLGEKVVVRALPLHAERRDPDRDGSRRSPAPGGG